MLPVTLTESPREAAQRQANFILLRFLEPKLQSSLFDQLIQQVSFPLVIVQISTQIEFPKRIDWKGYQQKLSFEELKTNFSHIDQNYLTELLLQLTTGSQVQVKKHALNNHTSSSSNLKVRALLERHNNLLLTLKSAKSGNMVAHQKINLQKYEVSRFERMKTVFGHALIEDGSCASIFNVQFDKTGKFIVSGADDGIIKIWDKDTLNLQASLHGHQDYITDIDISKCNKYIASASKDGVVIIWNLWTCSIIDKIQAHSQQVNNIKFFKYKIKEKTPSKGQEEFIQLLVTCSEDGTVKIYDEQGFLFNQHLSQEDIGIARRSRRQEQTQSKKERFFLTLTPEDFRPQARNKKIESVNINNSGIVVAGTSNGEIYLWKIDFSQFKSKQANKICTWIGSFKKHTKNIHYCDFSPNGKFLMTGSVDGTAKIWNMEFDKINKKEGSHWKQFQLKDERLKATLQEKGKKQKPIGINYEDIAYENEFIRNQATTQCDCVAWSCYGRYAIASVSGKIDGQQNVDLSFIKVWDSITDETIQDLGKHSGVQLQNYSFVIAPHPKIEEILMTGSSGGTIIIWDIKQRSMIKKFIEYGVYSIEKYTLNDPFDGKFSPDGSSFIVGSMLGTVSLFSTDGAFHKYEQTRVEQFSPYDDQKHDTNVYEQTQEQPQLCSFTLLPYEVQPPPPLIGKFTNQIQEITNEDYERQFVVRKEICKEEELFIQQQLQEGLQNNFFNADENAIEFQQVNEDIDMQAEDSDENELQIRRRRPRIDSEGEQEEASPANQQNNNQARRGRGRPSLNNNQNNQRQGRRQNLSRYEEMIRLNPNIDPENSRYDHDSDENFEPPEESDEDEEQVQGDESDDYQPKRENIHIEQQNKRQQRQRDMQETYATSREEILRRQQEGRTERAMRRLQREQMQEDDEEETKRGGRTRTNRRRIVESEEESNKSDDYGISDNEIKKSKRRLTRNNRNIDLPSSDDQSIHSDIQSEEEFLGGRQAADKRKTRNDAKRKGNVNTRQAQKNRVRYDHMDDSSQSDEEEKVIRPNGRQASKRQKIVQEESEEASDVEIIDTTSKNKKMRGDEDYELLINFEDKIELEEDMITQIKQCSFCQRIDEPLIGPFVKKNDQDQVVDGPHYFHKDCIEVNLYSFYNKSKCKWMNIGKALEMLTKKKSLKCDRCQKKGATIQCANCGKCYHGFYCSQIYMIWLGNQDYQCFTCRNLENHETFRLKPPSLEAQEVQITQKLMPREHQLQCQQSLSQFFPQVSDLVYYFFQGHERFIREYNCYFYSGDNPVPQFEYPWMDHTELLNPTLCKIVNISHSFPSKNALYLIKKFGKTSSDVQQVSHVLIILELEIVGNQDNRFTVEIFPTELPDFLVLKDLYEKSFIKFEEFFVGNRIIGQVFNTRRKNLPKVKVIGIQEKEKTLYPSSNWETINCIQVDAYRLRERGGRRGQRRPEDEENDETPQILNFWELILDESMQNDQALIPCAFEENESIRLQNVIIDYMKKKEESVLPFKSRVTDSIASDYRYHVPAEMYLELILERLLKKYYRTQDQLFSDLDLLSYNARIYNGDDDPLTKQAKKVVENLRCELRKNINSVGEKKHHKEEIKAMDFSKPIGKLTAPIRMEGLSSFDMFQNQQLDEQTSVRRNGKVIQEEQKTQTSQRNGRARLESNGMQQQSLDFKIVIENEDYDRATPKTQIKDENNGVRRTTRTSARLNYNETSHDNIMNGTGEKLTRRREEAPLNQDVQTLGKRTRNSRQKQINYQLNESDEDELVLDESFRNKPTKRLRH